jgi:hypothetical protein
MVTKVALRAKSPHRFKIIIENRNLSECTHSLVRVAALSAGVRAICAEA